MLYVCAVCCFVSLSFCVSGLYVCLLVCVYIWMFVGLFICRYVCLSLFLSVFMLVSVAEFVHVFFGSVLLGLIKHSLWGNAVVSIRERKNST